MKLTVTGKNLEITEAMGNHLNQKLQKSIMDLEDHVETHIVLATEKHRQIAEITIKTKGNSFHVKEETDYLYWAMDNAISKILKQLRKNKDRNISIKAKRNAAKKEKL